MHRRILTRRVASLPEAAGSEPMLTDPDAVLTYRRSPWQRSERGKQLPYVTQPLSQLSDDFIKAPMERLISFTTLLLSRLKKVLFFVEDVTIKSYIVCSFKCAPAVEELAVEAKTLNNNRQWASCSKRRLFHLVKNEHY